MPNPDAASAVGETPSPETVAAVAELTERQKQAILGARWAGSLCLVDYTEPWTVPVAEFLTLKTDRLNALGLAVRDHLRSAAEGSE